MEVEKGKTTRMNLIRSAYILKTIPGILLQLVFAPYYPLINIYN